MYVYLIMNKDLLLLFPVKGVSFSEGYIFSFFKFFAVAVSLAFARNSFWGWDIFAFLSLFTKGWNNNRYLSMLLLKRLTSTASSLPLVCNAFCMLLHYAVSLGCFCSSSLTLLRYAFDLFISFLLILYICYLLFPILACLHALFVSQPTLILS